MVLPKENPPNNPIRKIIDKARKSGCDEDEEHFDDPCKR